MRVWKVQFWHFCFKNNKFPFNQLINYSCCHVVFHFYQQHLNLPVRPVFVELENVLVSGCSKNASPSVCVRVCVRVCRACTAGWWRCLSYIISISLLHSDREEGGSCRLRSHHLQPAEASLPSFSSL